MRWPALALCFFYNHQQIIFSLFLFLCLASTKKGEEFGEKKGGTILLRTHLPTKGQNLIHQRPQPAWKQAQQPGRLHIGSGAPNSNVQPLAIPTQLLAQKYTRRQARHQLLRKVLDAQFARRLVTVAATEQQFERKRRLLVQRRRDLAKLARQVLPHDVNNEMVLHAALDEHVEAAQLRVHGALERHHEAQAVVALDLVCVRDRQDGRFAAVGVHAVRLVVELRARAEHVVERVVDKVARVPQGADVEPGGRRRGGGEVLVGDDGAEGGGRGRGRGRGEAVDEGGGYDEEDEDGCCGCVGRVVGDDVGAAVAYADCCEGRRELGPWEGVE